jgi:hypothetical protein
VDLGLWCVQCSGTDGCASRAEQGTGKSAVQCSDEGLLLTNGRASKFWVRAGEASPFGGHAKEHCSMSNRSH